MWYSVIQFYQPARLTNENRRRRERVGVTLMQHEFVEVGEGIGDAIDLWTTEV